jgi:hypothetical protein
MLKDTFMFGGFGCTQLPNFQLFSDKTPPCISNLSNFLLYKLFSLTAFTPATTQDYAEREISAYLLG